MGSWWAYPSLLVLGFQNFPKAWIGSQLFNKVNNILMILGSLALEKDFWILTQKLGYVITLWPNAFLQSLWYTHDLRPKTLGISWLYGHPSSSFWIFFSNFFLFSFKKFSLFFLENSLLKKLFTKDFFL